MYRVEKDEGQKDEGLSFVSSCRMHARPDFSDKTKESPWYNCEMYRVTPFVQDEHYHLYNRGAHKQAIFLDERDCRRFQVLLYLANDQAPIDVRNTLKKYEGESFVQLYGAERKSGPLVDILAYALLPNHFHLIVRQLADGGISAFMRKLCTGYSMYFNLRHGRSGTLFQGPYKGNHIDTDPYFQWAFAYVHLNPVAMVEPEWSAKRIADIAKAQVFLDEYRFSSYPDYYCYRRPERSILAYEDAMHLIETKKDVEALLSSYGRGRVLYTSHEPVEKKESAGLRE